MEPHPRTFRLPSIRDWDIPDSDIRDLGIRVTDMWHPVSRCTLVLLDIIGVVHFTDQGSSVTGSVIITGDRDTKCSTS